MREIQTDSLIWMVMSMGSRECTQSRGREWRRTSQTGGMEEEEEENEARRRGSQGCPHR